MGVPVHQERAAPPAEPTAERRDSARVPVKLLVRDFALGGSFEPFDGNLGIGGVWFEALHPPVGGALELRFLVPGAREEVHVLGDVVRVTREGDRFGAHVKFVDIPLEAELAIARWLQQG
jgi:hypothetical protein